MNTEDYFSQISKTDSNLFDLALGHQNNEDRYTGMEEIGRGASKTIHRVLDLSSGRSIALATPNENLNKEQLQSFLDEARLCASLQHPNIIQVYDLGYKQDGLPYFTMKLYEGKKLNEILNHSKTSLLDIMDIFLKVCEAMAYAHSLGAVHRDLKEENILIGNFGEVLVCDWGSVKILPKSTLELEVGQLSKPISLGTPGFMSPEQMNGEKAHINQDIYSLGALLYKMLCHKVPNTGDLIKPSDIRSDIPMGLEAICLKAMSFNPLERYQKCAELIQDIKAWQAGFAPQAEGASLQKQIKLFFLRHKTLSISCLVSLLIICALSLYSIESLKEKERQTAIQRDRAENALKLYDIEKESRQKIAALGADYFIRQAKQLISSHTSSLAKELLDSIPNKNLNKTQKATINTLYGRLYFYRQKFKLAITHFEKGKVYEDNKLLVLAREFVQKKSSDNNMLSTTDSLDMLDRLRTIDIHEVYVFFREEVLRIPNYKEQIHLIKRMILFNNPSLDTLNIKLSPIGDKFHLDLSNNDNLKRWEPIREMPLISLDLSNCPIRNHFFILNNMPLEELNLSGCEIKNYTFLKDLKSLKKLIVNSKEAQSTSLLKNIGSVELIIQ